MRNGLTLAALAAALAATPALAQHEITTKPADTTALLDELPAFEKPAVWFGSHAPGMHIAKWVKGDPVTEFQSGQVYVVEFWATWCVPCRKAFPHMTELQKTYGDKVRFVGVNIWDREQNRETGEYTEPMDKCLARITSFVEEHSDDMGYTVAIEESGKMSDAWMKAAGQNGIPTCFVVDGSGRIAWIGYPLELDEPLAQIVKGTFDSKAAATEASHQIRNTQWYQYVMKEIATGDSEKGYELAGALVDGPFNDDAHTLNSMAWLTLTSSAVAHRDPAFSIKAATRACELTDWKDPSILDTLARGYHDNGELAKAIKTQRQAVANAEDELKDELQKTLDGYLAEKE